MGEPGHFGFVVDAAAELGGDDLVKVFYRNGDTQTIRAGQGGTVGGGIHYRPVALPIDFAATVGYKFVRTAANNTDLGVNRVVIEPRPQGRLYPHCYTRIDGSAQMLLM